MGTKTEKSLVRSVHERGMKSARNREIGTALNRARLLRERTVTECAALVKTTRHRYRAIEQGKAEISVPELVILMHYLGVSGFESWPDLFPLEARRVEVQAKPGEIVQLLVHVME
jgi:hypothetical protein